MTLSRLPVAGDSHIVLMLDELARDGVRRMLAAALEIEADDYVARYVREIDADGRRLVVRNGYAHERVLRVGAEAVRLRAPRVNDRRVDARTGESHRFRSRILPAYARRSSTVTDLLPILYLHALSTGDFGPALRELLGNERAGLSAMSVTCLLKQLHDLRAADLCHLRERDAA